eukprot:TRINITY_DN25644_c0_g1_i1.p1 TRINITY_DN25644_c0_g1~~TRINITY_DN25644_c0_g1_i1.p1  ORF type:complete len:104 (-),score=33.42 TRINITY_DN25644_c0_g1_i1:24-335(-)
MCIRDSSKLVPLKSKPAMFDSSGLCVEQNIATSLDGTAVPYFVIRREGIAMDGSHPTLLDGYGCLLYTSDAADDLLCVDLGGRRIIKKKIIIVIRRHHIERTM